MLSYAKVGGVEKTEVNAIFRFVAKRNLMSAKPHVVIEPTV